MYYLIKILKFLRNNRIEILTCNVKPYLNKTKQQCFQIFSYSIIKGFHKLDLVNFDQFLNLVSNIECFGADRYKTLYLVNNVHWYLSIL